MVKDAEGLVESEVSSKSGISGMAIKAGYKAVRAIKPELIPEAIDNLLDRFVERMEPFYESWVGSGKTSTFGQYLNDRSTEVTNALLAVTDARAQKSSGTVKATYQRLRPQGEKNVKAALPGLGRIIDKYIS